MLVANRVLFFPIGEQGGVPVQHLHFKTIELATLHRTNRAADKSDYFGLVR